MWPVYALVAVALLQVPASSQLIPFQQASPVADRNTSLPAASIDPAQPVITVRGVCDKGSQPGECSKVITRKEFESLMDALNPSGQEISPSGRQNLAQAYVEALAFADAVRKAGAEESQQYREVLYWARLRTMGDLYRRNLQEQFRNPLPEEIDAYYRHNVESFEKVQLLRIVVPRENFSAGDKDEFDKKALAAAQTALARARKGEDPEQIQKDVYAGLGLERPPSASIGSYRRAELNEKEAGEVFSLQPGEVSQLQVELKSYVIYKLKARETLKEDQVKAEIVREISQKKYRDAINSVLNAAPAKFNEQYFGPMAPKPPEPLPVPPRLVR
jgi:uncharacterized protein (DUF2267 family)